MKLARSQREIASRRRIPPRPIMIALPSPAFADEPDPRIAYHVRSGARVVEIATAEDWFILAQYVGQPAADNLEIWATDQLAAEMSVRIHPNESREAATLLCQKLDAAEPETADEEQA